MGWKQWPSWVKGGVIGGFLGLLTWLYDYDFLLNAGGPSPTISKAINNFFVQPAVTPVVSSGLTVDLPPFNPFLPLSILIILHLLIGALIGWIVGKIKAKNNQSSQPLQ